MPADLLRVLTWNIRDLHGDPLAVHRVIRSAEADVVCLQEAPRLVLVRNQLAALARKSGMLYAAGTRASAGTALLTSLRVDVRDAVAVRLPVQGCWTRPRGFAAATCALPDSAAVRVASIHLGLTEEQRADHVSRIVAQISAASLPVVLGADLNEAPGGPSWTSLAAVARDPGAGGAPPTFPARRPRVRIDAVLVAPELDVVNYGEPENLDEDDVVRASDHRPVLAVIRLPARGA